MAKGKGKPVAAPAPPINGPPVERNPDGTVRKGSSLRKASMRTRAQRLSRRIAQRTRNGESLVDKLLALADDTGHPDHFKAVNALLNRFAGKETQPVEVSGPDGAPVQSDAKVTQHEQPPSPERMAAVLEVLARAGVLPGGSGGGSAGGTPPAAQ